MLGQEHTCEEAFAYALKQCNRKGFLKKIFEPDSESYTLKPCPICGAAEDTPYGLHLITSYYSNSLNLTCRYQVFCQMCGMKSGECSDLDDIDWAWNRRAT